MNSHDQKDLGLGTLAIHGGLAPDPSTGAVMPPIYATSTYAQSSPGVHQGFEYSRTHNPTRFAYERCVAALEGGTHGYAFASGLAATATVLDALDSTSVWIAGSSARKSSSSHEVMKSGRSSARWSSRSSSGACA